MVVSGTMLKCSVDVILLVLALLITSSSTSNMLPSVSNVSLLDTKIFILCMACSYCQCIESSTTDGL